MRTYIHCGYYKCGTTALQQTLTDQSENLRSQGVLYPRTGRERLESHSELSFAFLHELGAHIPQWFRNMFRGREFPKFAQVAQDLRNEIEFSGAEKAIISSEELTRLGDTDNPEVAVEQFLSYFKDLDPVAVFYLRRPDHYMVSWYSQLLHIGAVPAPLSREFRKFLSTVHGNYAAALEPWYKALGSDNVIVRRYEDATKGDVVRDFADLAGFELGAVAPRANKSLPAPLLEAFRQGNLANRDFRYRQLRQAAVLDLMEAPIKNRINRTNIDFFGIKGRQELVDKFRPINARLGELTACGDVFFPDLDEILELPPKPRLDQEESARVFGPYLQNAIMARIAAQ